MRFPIPVGPCEPPGALVSRSVTVCALLLGPIAAVAWVQGCGPSVQSVYEGNVRFEHCYRLDLDPNIAASHREACWRSYTGRYHYGQTKDRVEYARRRIRALASGDTSRPVLRLDLVDAAAAQISPAEAPMPTSAHAPPPPTARATPDASPGDARNENSSKSPPPGAVCATECRETWDKAGPGCTDCERDYRSCMQRCYE